MACTGSKSCVKSIMFLIVFVLLSMQQCKCSELELLLLMKTSMKDPLGSLHDWISSQSLCHWNGVVCDDLSHVAKIELSGKNLSGKLSETIFNLPYVESIDLSNNQLSGEIPINFSSCLALRFLNLSNNNFTGPLPQGSRIPLLETLDLSNNMISGKIHESVGLFSRLKVLDFGGNVLVGSIPKSIANISSLEFLTLASNQLIGEIPREIGLMKNLKLIYLGYNNFSGGIPEEIGELTSLYHVDLVHNNLTGEIPSSLGEIPVSLSHCKSLQRVRLQNNHLTGELSLEFTKLPLVYFLDISGNNLFGSISERKWDMPKLQMLNLARNKFLGTLPDSFGSKNLENLDLSENDFYGTIPKNFRQLSELMELKLRSNKLSGEIPDELSSCKKLVSLDLSHNQLSGQIPTCLSEMPVLSLLDLSMNQLSGEIPPNLGKVESLVLVNISYNHFHGNLPSTGAFLAINSSAVVGNQLCGRGDGITSGLPPCKSLEKSSIWWFFLTCLLGILVLLAFSALVVVFIQRRRELKLKKVESAQDGNNWEIQFFDSKASKSITLDDILGIGVPYKGFSEISNTQVFVKRLNVDIPKSFWTNIHELGNIRHPNVVKIMAACKSEKGGIVVYEYVEGKDLSEVIRVMSWEHRQKVAIGIARALKYLHCSCSPSIFAGEISPRKVIVDGKDEARLRLSLPTMGFTSSKGFSFTAYVGPEYNGISEKSDIYGFGLLLIELLTGRNPSDAEFGKRESIIDWARYCYSECHLDTWVEPIMKSDAVNNQNKMVEMMNVALQCTASEPPARPCASDVVKTLDCFVRSNSCGLGLKRCSSV
ncbi:leucine-rich repeat receptor-like serine/threonine-protein kinase SKM1 isoform X4 [Capsicum annuum]|uniref:leucine-rich repeat receptor-like serine/threonine-protein kinase SKM1 isoform X4 n=1 Tax=Capsicum annuum TaxID=4072 RepID=UPI0007BF07DE|nr:leucine-rich repeat receptor-like serine/threonine-protein kinase SKM1 isoform X4 [Capsicum annuum]